MEQQRIVIIEDDTDLRDVMAYVLTSEGYRVTALNAITSLEDLLHAHADCFVLDEQLPYVSGHIICIMLKSKPETRNVPVVLVSASPGLQGQADLSEADAFLEKPFRHINDLSKTIHTLLDRNVKSLA